MMGIPTFLFKNGTYPIYVCSSSQKTELEDSVIVSNQKEYDSPYSDAVINAYNNIKNEEITDEIFNEFSYMFNESYLVFIVENNTTIQTINIKDFNYQDLTGKIIFNDIGENIHWTSDDNIERIFKDDYTQVKGTGYTRPNYDDVYTETKLYKNKNHMIEFDYKHNIDDLIIFNDFTSTPPSASPTAIGVSFARRRRGGGSASRCCLCRSSPGWCTFHHALPSSRCPTPYCCKSLCPRSALSATRPSCRRANRCP